MKCKLYTSNTSRKFNHKEDFDTVKLYSPKASGDYYMVLEAIRGSLARAFIFVRHSNKKCDNVTLQDRGLVQTLTGRVFHILICLVSVIR